MAKFTREQYDAAHEPPLNHQTCIYCDARTDSPLCETCIETLNRYRGVRRSVPRVVQEPFKLEEFIALVYDVAAKYELTPVTLLKHSNGTKSPRITTNARAALFGAMRARGLTLGEIGAWVKRERSSVWHTMHIREAANA